MHTNLMTIRVDDYFADNFIDPMYRPYMSDLLRMNGCCNSGMIFKPQYDYYPCPPGWMRIADNKCTYLKTIY
jgi:hypothetical protein